MKGATLSVFSVNDNNDNYTCGIGLCDPLDYNLYFVHNRYYCGAVTPLEEFVDCDHVTMLVSLS